MYLEDRQGRLAKTAVLTGLPPCVTVVRHRPILDTFQIDKPLQGKVFLLITKGTQLKTNANFTDITGENKASLSLFAPSASTRLP